METHLRGDELATLRRFAELSVADLAKTAGVSPSAAHAVEAGFGTAADRAALADVLDVYFLAKPDGMRHLVASNIFFEAAYEAQAEAYEARRAATRS